MKHSFRVCAILVIFVLLFTVSFAFAEDTPVAGVANPMHEASTDTIASKTGANMTAPTFASTVSWFTYDGNPEIVEMRFTVGTQEYNYRAAKADKQTDISGMYYTWGPWSSVKVDDVDATLTTAGSGEGLVLWYDAQNGITYSLSVKSDAAADTLTKIASQVYVPVKPVTVEAPTGTVTGCVTYATNDSFGLKNNSINYDFLISSDTVIDCYYFDTGDYLTVEYSGYLGSQLNALHITKVSVVVTPTPQPVPTYEPAPIKPVENPMITGEAYINTWGGSYCTLSTGVTLTVPDDIDLPAGYWPQDGDYVGFTYNSALMELRYLYCINRWQPEPEPTPGYLGDEPVIDEPAPGYLGDEPEIAMDGAVTNS